MAPSDRGGAKVFTVGHSKRSIEELVTVLRAHGVGLVCDVRKMPRSKTHPQFNAEVLPHELAPHGIEYAHFPALGGLRPKSPDSKNDGWRLQSFRNYADYAETHHFRDGLDALCAHIKKATCALMCSEVLWWRCHRRIIADYLLARGLDVVHLINETAAEPAVITAFAEVQDDGTIRYRAR